MSQPTAYEQYLLELINAERGKAAVQPLAFDTDLNDAADNHNAWMIATDTFSHTGSGGSNPGQRMTAEGYSFTGSWTWGENIAWGTTRSPVGYQDEVQLLHTNLMNSAGHKANLLNANFREVGLGVAVGEYGGREGAFVTEDFAKTGSSVFVTGVAFDDKDGDRFYDPGEGMGGLTVTVKNIASGQTLTATTMDAGGYDVALSSGTYSVTFSGASIATWSKQVTVGSSNMKVDLVDPDSGSSEPPPPPPPGPVAITGTAYSETIQGTAGDDAIYALGGSDFVYGLAGNDRVEGGTGSDRLYGGDGNDTLLGGDSTDTLYGGMGLDVLTGGTGSDRFVFNSLPEAAIDRVTDYSVPYDTIWLENGVFAAIGNGGTLASAAFYRGAQAHDTTDRVLYDSSTGIVKYDPDGTGGAVAAHVAQLQGGLALTYADFYVI